MADSDYSGSGEDVSDDEYVGPKGGSSSRPQAATRKRAPLPARAPEKPKKQAWETEEKDPDDIVTAEVEEMEEEDPEVLARTLQEREEDRKRKRLRKDTKPFQRGIIRHVVLVLDLSETMLERDMRPNRYITMIRYTQEYVREFFEQNPISQMSVLECIGIGASYAISHTQSWNTRSHHRLRVSNIPRSGRYTPDHQGVCQGQDTRRTNAGDESEYVIATDQELLRELLLATTTPPVVRSTEGTSATPAESAAALMMMGFPSRVVEDVPTMCACHGNLTTGGYTCSRCSAKVCSLPVTCPSCQLTLLLSTHLARSYHHLFPLRNWVEVSWSRARQKRSRECISCLSSFPEPPPVESSPADEEMQEVEKVAEKSDQLAARQRKMDKEDSEEQKASESARYECRACEGHFCIDCDMFCHLVLHNCPGCLSRLNPAEMGQANGDVEMTGLLEKMSFERLIRFEADDGKTYYGNLNRETPTLEIEGSKVEVLSGDVKEGFRKTGGEAIVSKLLCPLPGTNIVMCVGLNYKHHAEEANIAIPKFPTIFTKPSDALTGPLADVSIHKDCQSQLDYEGELTIIIGRDAKNVSAADALSYVLGYTVGNDVSARNFQLPADISGGQFGYAKSFDGFAPIGPAIVSTSVIPDPQKLRYTTKVNGEKRQETGTDDMIWSVKEIIEHLSRGTTLRAGTAIMTGTPSGVGIFMEPKGFLKDGDVVTIEVEGIGSLVNKMVFE
ncbi:hypothetical protein K504DRAFT_481012 [Pleomassaria siparia CBS 279.74]|uniref:C2H2-type domain-containing protein n=1 Tax=Pleomassaria siparia CBS 279.74 TaxID=1314801 RepID=A0A6G1KF62_9PLEO|nr:hypothetical protein K504DRAFT_481012 [Pleomassaria siparia CBS 279.74]